MARVSQAVLSQAYATDNTAPMLDLSYGGQGGWTPNLVEWVSNQAYVRRNLICILLEAPKLFTLFPNSSKWIQSLKALVELHTRSIEGFNAGLTVETDEHPVGGAGEMQQEVTDVKRARTEPRFTFIEKYGRPIQTLLDYWIRYGLMDPETKFALASTLSNRPQDMLADWYSMTCLFIEPDPLHRRVTQAWVTTNMYPLSNGDITGRRDLTAAQELLTLDITFAGISQYGAGVNKFAQTILDRITLTNADPFMKPSWIQSASSDVNAVSTGYQSYVQNVGSNSVKGSISNGETGL